MIAGPEAAGHLKEVSLEALQDHVTTAYEEMAQGIVAATKADVEKMQEGYAVAAEFVAEFNVAEKATATFPLGGKTLTLQMAKDRLKKKIIRFIDFGQDMTYMEIRQDGILLTAGPFQAHIWKEYYCLNYEELASATDSVKLLIVTDEKVEERTITLSIRELDEVECDLDEIKAEHPAYPPTPLYKFELKADDETHEVAVREDGTILSLDGSDVDNRWSDALPINLRLGDRFFATENAGDLLWGHTFDEFSMHRDLIATPEGWHGVNGLPIVAIVKTWCNLSEAVHPPTALSLLR